MQNYIMVDNEVSREFQMNGIMPKYFDGENYYFIRNDELSKFINNEDIKLNLKGYAKATLANSTISFKSAHLINIVKTQVDANYISLN